jgi:hypothetical protein
VALQPDQAHAQSQFDPDVEPPPIMMKWAEPPPIIGLSDGKLRDLTPLRSGKYGIRLTVNQKVQPTPVQFQAVAMRNGEKMAERSRTMVIWPSGDQVREQMFCPDSWDVMPMLYEASEEGRLPEGEYEISLFITTEREEPLAEPVSFQLVVE